MSYDVPIIHSVFGNYRNSAFLKWWQVTGEKNSEKLGKTTSLGKKEKKKRVFARNPLEITIKIDTMSHILAAQSQFTLNNSGF